MLRLILLYELTVFAVASDEVLHETVPAEYEKMVHQLVEEMAVVRYYYQRAAELLQIFFKYVERHDVKVVGRLVKNQQVRLLHQDRKQVETAFFSSAELLYLVVQHFMREKETVEQPGVVHYVQNGVVRVEGNAALVVIPDLK